MDTVVLRPDMKMKPIDRLSKARTAGFREAMIVTPGTTMNIAASIHSTVMVSGELYTLTACLARTVLPPVAAPAVSPGQAPDEVAAVRAPACGEGVAAGQEQSEHHRHCSHGYQDTQGLAGKGNGKERSKRDLDRYEKGDPRCPDGAQARIGRGASDCELHHPKDHDPEQYRPGNIKEVGR